MHSSKSLAMMGLALLMLPIDAWAQDQRAGHDLAKQLCARCHAIDKTSASAHVKAPPFRVIANYYSVWSLQEALAEGIVTGHGAMPEFVLNPDEIADLLSFMDTFATTKSKSQ